MRVASETYGRLRQLRVVSEDPSGRGSPPESAKQKLGGSLRGGNAVKPSSPKSAVRGACVCAIDCICRVGTIHKLYFRM